MDEGSELQFYGPFQLAGSQEESILLSPKGKLMGVYLLTIPFENKYLPYYVGETGVSFASRSMDHVKCFLNGFYRIYDPEAFATGKKILVWGGMWKSNRKGSDTMIEYLQQYHKLSSLSYTFLNLFRFFLAPFDSDDRLRQRLEAAIASKLLEQDGIIGSFQDNDIRYYPRRPKEQPIKIKLKVNELILGLSGELTI